MKKFLLILAALCGTAFGQNIQADSLSLSPLTVSTLPAASANTGRIFSVSDGTSTTDCSTGGGSTLVLCLSNGSTYTAVGGSVGVWTTISGLSTAGGFDNSVPINAAITAATGGGTLIMPAGIYQVLNPINAASFVTLRGAGPMGSTTIQAASTMSPQLNVIQSGYNSSTCGQEFGTVTVTGTLPGVLTLPVQNSVGGGGSITATSTLSGSNVIATFTGTFGGTGGILPIAQQTLVGTGFTGVTNYNSTWTVISATTTTIVAYQAGGSSFGSGSTGTLSLQVAFPAAGPWNGPYVFVAGVQYQITSSTSSSLTLASYNGPTGSQTFQGIYSGCPTGFSVENLTIDANCGVSNASGVPCSSGGRGTGAGNALTCRGCYRSIFRDLLIMHCPNDCLYTEGGLFVNNVIPPYAGGSTGTFGLATTVFVENVRVAEANNDGIEHLGPSDGMFINAIVSFPNAGGSIGNVGYRAACIPGSYGVCGNDTFLFGTHVYKTGSWDYQFLAEQYVSMAEAETSATNGAFGVDQQLDFTGPSGVLSNGMLVANGLVADLITGDCLYLASPNTAFASGFAVGNTIQNINCSGTTGYGLHVPIHALDGTAVGKSHISVGLFEGPTSGTASGGACLGGNSASINDLRFINQSSTIPSFGIDLSCGGTVTSLNRFIGRNLNAVNYGSQIKWPAAAVASQVDVFVAANGSQNQYCTAANSCGVGIPTGLDVTLHGVCNGCLDNTDPNISTTNAGFAPPFAIGSFPACTALLGGQRYSANNCNAACSTGGTCTAGGAVVCEMYCKGSATSWLETGLTE